MKDSKPAYYSSARSKPKVLTTGINSIGTRVLLSAMVLVCPTVAGAFLAQNSTGVGGGDLGAVITSLTIFFTIGLVPVLSINSNLKINRGLWLMVLAVVYGFICLKTLFLYVL